MKTENEEVPVLLFYVNAILCMLPVKVVTSIEMPQNIILSVPDMPECVRGMCSLKGNDIILIDLEKLLNFKVYNKEKNNLDGKAIVVLEGNIGFVSEQIVGVDLLEHFERSMHNEFCGRMVDSLYTISAEIRSYYHIQKNDNIVFCLNISEIINFIKINNSCNDTVL